jgi:hypothetical protein
MDSLRVRFELDKGRVGVSLSKLGSFSVKMHAFLNNLAGDIGIDPKNAIWIAENFENKSVDFDCRLAGDIDHDILHEGREVIRRVVTDNYPNDFLSLKIKQSTRQDFWRATEVLEAGELVGVAVYSNGEDEPAERFFVSGRTASVAQEVGDNPPRQLGEVQGRVCSLFKEADPHITVRELSTKQLVKCYFPPSLYVDVVQALKDPEAVVYVTGWITEDSETGWAHSMDITLIETAPHFDVTEFTRLMGSAPGYRTMPFDDAPDNR